MQIGVSQPGSGLPTQLAPPLGHRGGDDGLEKDREVSQRFAEVVHDGGHTRALGRIFGQFEWLGAFNEAIGHIDHPPDRLESAVELPRFQGGEVLARQRGHGRPDFGTQLIVV